MGMQLPPELIRMLSMLGMTWPEADEDLLRDRGEQWLAFAEAGAAERDEANQSIATMLATNSSPGLESFEKYWDRIGGDWGHLNGSVVTAQSIGIAYITAAAIVLAMKIAVMVQLAALLVVVTAAAAAAFWTVGTSMAAAAAYARTIFTVIQRIVRAAIQAISLYGPRLASIVGALLEIVTKVIDARPIHHGEAGQDGPQSLEDEQAAAAERQRRFDDLSFDTDKGKRDENSRREASIALEMEQAGLLPPPVSAPTGAGQGDFIDGEGTSWDVKGFRSTTPNGKNEYSDEAAAKNIDKQVQNGRNVVLDMSKLNAADRESLKTLIKNHPDWHGKVVVY